MPTRAADSSTVDTTALTEPIDAAALRAYRETLPAEIRGNGRRISAGDVTVFVVFTALGAVWLAMLISADQLLPSTLGEWALQLVSAGVLAFIPAITIAAIVRNHAARSGRRQFRLARFARANGLDYRPVGPADDLPGMLFSLGVDERMWDAVGDPPDAAAARAGTGRGLTIANLEFTTGSGKNARTHRWGLATLRIGNHLPHIVLDATGNNALGATSLPITLDPAQRLGLEGDFDRHFTLYAPRGYEKDALYIFTPDIMARFIDNAAALDVEIVDDRLFLYARRDLSTLHPATWEWLLTTIDALSAKFAQWRRWRDDRLGETRVGDDDGMPRIVRPPRGVAIPGRRLRQSGPHWIWIVIAVVAATYAIWSIIDEMILGFFR